MLRHLLILGLLAGCATAYAQTPQQPGEIFAGLTGGCSKAELGDGCQFHRNFPKHCPAGETCHDPEMPPMSACSRI